eukprot:6008494-Alexandrium_andersonii.AAC.1
MSASLVGSEMCIRDSSSSEQFPPLLVAYSQLSRASVAVRFWRASRGDGPVSYTHLTLPTICSV